MADQETSSIAFKGQSPNCDTGSPIGSSLSHVSSSTHGNLVAEPLSPLQDQSPPFSGPAASALSEWDFVFEGKAKKGNTLSIISLSSIASNDCAYPADLQAAPASVDGTVSSYEEILSNVDTPALSRKRKNEVMPYNNTAIPPSEEITGSTALPLARVKRILQADEEISPCSNSAAFAITVATEMFVRYLAEKSLDVVKSERKPRRNIQYKDVANAVARFDNLEFLSDVVPKTVTYGEYKRRVAEKEKRKQELQNGQTTLNASRSLPKRQTEVIDVDEEFPDEQDESVNPPINGHFQAGPSHINGNGDMVDDHETNDDSHHGGSEDVEMI